MGRLIVGSACTPSAIPLIDRGRHHSSVPTNAVAAAARGNRLGRPNGRREAASPWTVASTVACLPSVGIAACSAVTSVLFAILMVACTANELNRILSKLFAFLAVRDWEQGQTDRGRRDKSADCCRAFLVGSVGVTEHRVKSPAGAFAKMSENTVAPEPSLIPSSWGRL